MLQVSIQVRGKGELYARVYGKKQNGFLQNIDSPDNWSTFSGLIEVPENPGMFWLRVTGSIDFDNLLILPAEEENMPTAEKHQ